MNTYDVIRKPIITEKATMASEANAVVFEVAIGPPQGSQESRRDASRGQHHRYHDRSVRADPGPSRGRDSTGTSGALEPRGGMTRRATQTEDR